MWFFGSHHAPEPEEEEPEEETAVTHLFTVLEKKLKKNRESIAEACDKADELSRAVLNKEPGTAR